MYFKIEEIDDDFFIINNKIRVCIDCAQSINLSTLDRQPTTTLEASKILKCLVTDVDYENAYCSGSIWIMPKYILFEKNGEQLEITKKIIKYYLGVKYNISKLSHNIKTKNTTKLLSNEGVLYNIDTLRPE